jgi:hypothetical protein
VLILISAFFSLVYFLIAAEVWKMKDIDLIVLGRINFVSLLHTIIAIVQFGLSIVFYQKLISQRNLKFLIVLFSILILVDGLNLILKKIYLDNAFVNNLYYTIHAMVIYIATGILTLFYFLLRPLLISIHAVNETDITVNMKNEYFDKNRFRIIVALLVCSVVLVIICFMRENWKLGGSVFLGVLLLCGFVYRWSQRAMSKISARNIWILYIVAIMLGLIGGWYDFFTGFLFFFSAFGILISTGSRREVSMGRLFISLATVCFGFLLLAFHFIFSID